MSDYPPPPPGGMPPGPPPGAPPPPPGMPPPPPSGGGPQLYQPPPPSYGAPPPVGAQPMGQYGYGMAPKTNTLAIISLVASLVWVCGLGSIAAVITGFMARKQIAQSGGTQTGSGLAVAGIIIGGLGVVGLVLWVLLVVVASVSSDSNALAHLAVH